MSMHRVIGFYSMQRITVQYEKKRRKQSEFGGEGRVLSLTGLPIVTPPLDQVELLVHHQRMCLSNIGQYIYIISMMWHSFISFLYN